MAIRALIIDDEPGVLSVLKTILKKRGFEVTACSSPVDSPLGDCPVCPCLLHPNCPQVIMSDYDMPVMNGLEFWERQLEKGCRCRNVALISGKGLNEKEFRRLTKLGMKLFLKPFDRQAIHDWLDDVELSIASSL